MQAQGDKGGQGRRVGVVKGVTVGKGDKGGQGRRMGGP